MRGVIGELAQWTIEQSDKARFKKPASGAPVALGEAA